MPNRFIKDSIRTSASISKLTFEEEVFWYRLITLCDDHGRYDGRAGVIRAYGYPLALDRVSEADVEGYLVKLAELGSVVRYEVEGKPYLWIPRWAEHQQVRSKTSKWPDPPPSDNNGYHALADVPVVVDVDVDVDVVVDDDGKSFVSEKPVRRDVEDLCELLAEQIRANGSRKPTVTKKWLTAARLMLDRDERPLEEAEALIRWSQADEFWRSNVLSMPKFRDQYDQLLLQSKRKAGAKRYKPGERALELAGVDVAAETKRWEEGNGASRSHEDRGLPGGVLRP